MRKTSDPVGRELSGLLKGAYRLWDLGALKDADYDAIARIVVGRASVLHAEKKLSLRSLNGIFDEQSANALAVHDIPDLSAPAGLPGSTAERPRATASTRSVT